jgi:predicted component of type VI protein secretion system
MSAYKDNYQDRKRMQASIQRTIEKYEGKMALVLAWEAAPSPDRAYLRKLKNVAGKLRAQLRIKGVLE